MKIKEILLQMEENNQFWKVMKDFKKSINLDTPNPISDEEWHYYYNKVYNLQTNLTQSMKETEFLKANKERYEFLNKEITDSEIAEWF